jgi:anti-sigma regulatory factor (Ser/Thr protein kinase)/anti-anti-sigma regulatory factor
VPGSTVPGRTVPDSGQPAAGQHGALEGTLGEQTASMAGHGGYLLAADSGPASDRGSQDSLDVIVGLQHALLPAAVPVLPQARLAAQYQAAGNDCAAGGDWFDAVLIGDGMVALVVGDVVGRGLAAVAAMSQLRAVLSDRLAANPDVAGALAEADEFAVRTPGLRSATLAVLALDPASGAFRYATYGHPPPLVVDADGSARFLPTTRGGPLGSGMAPMLLPGVLGPDELVLLYTNGVLSRPGETASRAMADLAAAATDAASRRELAAGAPHAAERLCQLAVELAAGSGSADDAVALAVHRLPEPAPALQLELPGTLAALRTARHALTPWLKQIGAGAADRTAIQLGVAEVLLNAVEHAYPADGAGLIGLDAALRDDGYVECRVTDHGAWRVPGITSDRGRGLMMVEHLLDDVVVSHPPQVAGSPRGIRGTMVTLRHSLTRPPVLAPAAGPAAFIAEDVPFSVVAGSDGGACDSAACDGAAWHGAACDRAGSDGGTARAAVHGAADVFSAAELTRELLAISRGGTLPLAVDLTGVSVLASAGVRALFEVRSQLAAHHQPMTIVALAGSTTAFVLDLVQLSYSTGLRTAALSHRRLARLTADGDSRLDS